MAAGRDLFTNQKIQAMRRLASTPTRIDTNSRRTLRRRPWVVSFGKIILPIERIS